VNIPLIGSIFSLIGFFKGESPTPTQRKHLFHLALAIGFISTLLLSYPLWTSNRSFPLAPLWGDAMAISLPGNTAFILLLTAALLSLLLPRRDLTAGVTAIICTWAMVEDINRAHPWMLYYTLGWATIALTHQKDIQFTVLMRLLMVCVYFWSGVHKINPNFFEYAWPYLVEGVVGKVGQGSVGLQLGYAIPVIESGLAIGLLFPRSRKWAMSLLIAMHIGILMSIGPTGQNWNLVVWPWNLIMVVNLLILFSKERTWLPKVRIARWWFANLFILLVGIMPALHILHLWPPYLSWSVYSMKQSELLITVDEHSAACLPKNLLEADFAPSEAGLKTYYLLDWSTQSLKTPHFPHSLVYARVAEELCSSCKSESYLEIVERERYWKRWQHEFYLCQ